MCFFKYYNSDKHKIADKDIVCYKSVYVNPEDDNPKEGRSICAGFHYKVGETYNEKTVLLDELDKKQTLRAGVFHSYTRISNEVLKGLVAHNEYWWYQRSVITEFVCVMECVIPAGTPYWENLECQEYASTSIKVLRIMNPIKVLNGEER